ncbi:hypothetical protein GCM10027036_35040 [Flavihumibacter cheonanensis]
MNKWMSSLSVFTQSDFINIYGFSIKWDIGYLDFWENYECISNSTIGEVFMVFVLDVWFTKNNNLFEKTRGC